VKPYLLPISLLVAGTLLALGAGAGVSTTAGMLVGLGDGEVLTALDAPPPAADEGPADGDGDGVAAARKAQNARASQGAAGDRPARRGGLSRQRYVETILERNIFDHTKVGQEATAEDEPCVGEECELGEKSDLPVTLLGTVVAVPIEMSAALIHHDDEKKSYGYGIGDRILDATVLAIAADRVIVKRGDGSQEYIARGEIEEPDRRRAPAGDLDEDDQISKEGDDRYVISRELVDQTLGDMNAIMRMARARPHKDADGNVDGFRLSGVRRNKLIYKLGVRSGDIIHSVNGQPLTSIQEAMGAFESMQRDSEFSFEITRRGQKKTMQYEVR
jgi:type II secretion system protein C